MLFIETSISTQLAAELLDDESLRALQNLLLEKPERGTGDCRYGRVAKVTPRITRSRQAWRSAGNLLLAKRAVDFYRCWGFEVILEVSFDAVTIMNNAHGVEFNLITNGVGPISTPPNDTAC